MKGYGTGWTRNAFPGVVTAFMSDEYLDILAEVNNAETAAGYVRPRTDQDVMGVWRESARTTPSRSTACTCSRKTASGDLAGLE